MGNRGSAPTQYIRGLWKDDDEVHACPNCSTGFGMTRRKHHCRCCGSIFCSACWGKRIHLPPEYGYPDPEPVCTLCFELFQGRLMELRRQRCVLVTFALRDSKKPALPPFCAANVREKAFKRYYLNIGHWRPFDEKTALKFSVKLDKRGGGTANTSSPGVGGPAVPRPSFIDMGGGGGALGSTNGLARDDDTGSETGRRSLSSIGSGHGGSGCFDPGDARDVAFTVPLNTISHVFFDRHAEGDYVTLETAQQYIRIQCVDLEPRGSVSGAPPSLSGGGSSDPMVRLTVPGTGGSSPVPSGGASASGGRAPSESSNITTATTTRKYAVVVNVEETLKLQTELSEARKALQRRAQGGRTNAADATSVGGPDFTRGSIASYGGDQDD